MNMSVDMPDAVDVPDFPSASINSAEGRLSSPYGETSRPVGTDNPASTCEPSRETNVFYSMYNANFDPNSNFNIDVTSHSTIAKHDKGANPISHVRSIFYIKLDALNRNVTNSHRSDEVSWAIQKTRC